VRTQTRARLGSLPKWLSLHTELPNLRHGMMPPLLNRSHFLMMEMVDAQGPRRRAAPYIRERARHRLLAVARAPGFCSSSDYVRWQLSNLYFCSALHLATPTVHPSIAMCGRGRTYRPGQGGLKCSPQLLSFGPWPCLLELQSCRLVCGWVPCVCSVSAVVCVYSICIVRTCT